MLWLQIKYINQISLRLKFFKKTGENLWNFRCPFCMDSKKSATKARGYLYERKGSVSFRCHNNCRDASMGFDRFLKRIDQAVYTEYRAELFREKIGREIRKSDRDMDELTPRVDNTVVTYPEKDNDVSILDKLMDRCDRLEDNHMAITYLKSRRIPKNIWNTLYFLDDTKKIEGLKKKYEEKLTNEPRLVFPVYNQAGRLCGLQCRDLSNNSSVLRYLLVRLNDQDSLIYNIDKIHLQKKYYVVEGPVDSLFLPNCAAVLTSDLYGKFKGLLGFRQDLLDNGTFVYDNQPKNPEIVKLMNKAAGHGAKVCVWPEYIKEKDINEMITDGGYAPKDVYDIINKNTFNGLRLKAEISNWRKV